MLWWGNAVADEAMETAYLPIDLAQASFVTDGVMGGVSSGTMQPEEHAGRSCIALRGRVSTANNGGFIQMAVPLAPAVAKQAQDYDGIRITVAGNDEAYNLHLRTSNLWFPWQAYRATYTARPEWQTLELAFADFVPYKTSQSLKLSRLTRIGIVAIGRDFEADLCVAAMGFYRSGS
jgi:hypothetical protein